MKVFFHYWIIRASGIAWLLLIIASNPFDVQAVKLRSPHSAEACLDCHANRSLSAKDAAGIPTILLPENDDPHRALYSSCTGCHPDNVPSFWLLVFPKKMSVGVPDSPPPSIGKAKFPNPHDAMECKKCHKTVVSFDTTSLSDKELIDHSGDISDFCLRCHQGIINQHFPSGTVPVGDITCLSCHHIHHPTSIPPLLKEDYYTFIRETRNINPHGGNRFCFACHPNKPLPGDPPEFIFGKGQLDKLCLRCHPASNHHVINTPPSEKTWKMEFLDYPLQNGSITCITCHNPHGSEAMVEGVASYFLRGEPYTKMVLFCQNCHDETSFKKINPHDQMTPDGTIISKSCFFCHTTVLDVSGNHIISPDDFNDSYLEICLQCHKNFAHPNANHITVPDKDVLASIKEYEVLREVILPLDFDGSITCVTCHNPHEKALLVGPDAVGADEEKRLRLTTFNEICTPCHGRH